MKQTQLRPLICLISVSIVGFASANANEPSFKSAKGLQVVELFTSQSCPFSVKGDENLRALAGRDDLLALSYSVTYWNYTGWKDTNAQKKFDQRQAWYNERLMQGWLATPQMVINGRGAIAGDDKAVLAENLSSKQISPMPVRLARSTSSVVVKPNASSLVPVLVLYDAGEQSVAVTGGKNKGKRLTYLNVVREVRPLAMSDGVYSTQLSESEQGLSCAILMQDMKTGHIDAAARCDG